MRLTAEVRSRVAGELDRLGGNVRAELVEDVPAVIYRGLATPLVADVPRTDVLVLVPGGYPGAMLDYAYLPSDSKLRGVVRGAPQEDSVVAGGRTWKRVSYHPHTNGGAPPWDPTRHGFHTYVDEILSWLAVRQ